MKKKLLGASFAAFTALMLAACGGTDNANDNKGTGGKENNNAAAATYEPEELRVQFIPSQNAETLEATAKPLENLLSKELGIPVKVSVSTDYSAVTTALGAKQIDVGYLPPNAYVEAKKQGYAEVLLQSQRFGVNPEDGSETDELVDSYKAQIVVRADSDIKSVEDLKGKTIAFQNATSAGGYVWPAATMLDAGVDPQTDVNPVVLQGHDAALLALLNGEVEAATTFHDARNLLKKEFPNVFDDLRILTTTEDIPNDTVSVRADMSDEWKKKISDAFIALGEDEEGSKIIYEIYTHRGYTPSKDSNFDIVREYADRIQQN
ncbi:phosphate/phosphite/phosphonate ABC transporter substrate-binding protein [Shouchella lonarensis]|uniref:Phosphonate transport system substrate-binding protein n=1 Tax=Shouchella lonarensis TaxID=1464122 RepID=A0A1G6MHV7_9BACI|nr:phosphate/phosphite/phosphonate ABC transporter substrate-binding protein [Shouchella lonarensis]SDC55070.1 phosphonate transport system substrate-binding protein [Shouchella lonarensis]